MPNPAVMTVSRKERRILLRAEERRRASGDWGAWKTATLPNGTGGRGWNRQVRQIHRNAVFAVLSRPPPDGHTHLAISSLSGLRPSWWEAQRIKNEIAGEGATAVEVYPPQAEVVDGADMYHLWVLPSGLPFSLYGDRSAEQGAGQ